MPTPNAAHTVTRGKLFSPITNVCSNTDSHCEMKAVADLNTHRVVQLIHQLTVTMLVDRAKHCLSLI